MKNKIIIAKSNVTGSFWVTESGFVAENPSDASRLTKEEVSWLHYSFPKLEIVTVELDHPATAQ